MRLKLVQFGVPLESALKAATMNPAKSVGLGDSIGSLSVGREADILVLGNDLSLRQVLHAGQP